MTGRVIPAFKEEFCLTMRSRSEVLPVFALVVYALIAQAESWFDPRATSLSSRGFTSLPCSAGIGPAAAPHQAATI